MFSPVHRHLLKRCELDKTQVGLDELKELLYKYYAEKMNSALDTLWESGTLSQERLDEINGMDLHAL